MKSRILLINFAQNEVDRLNKLNIQIDRGYISDVRSYIAPREGEKREEVVAYYLPHPIYEYKVGIVNLNTNKEVIEEFKGKAKSLQRNIRGEFFKFWIENGILIVFLGNYNYTELINIGIPRVFLEEVHAHDITCHFLLDDKTSFRKCFKELQAQVTMPTDKYITIEEKFYKDLRDATMKKIYCNPGDELLGIYLNNRPYYDNADVPRYIILPQFKNNILVIEKLLKEISKIYTKLLPEIYEPDWVDSDKYYPNEVGFFDKEMDKTIEKTKERISELLESKEDAKKKYTFLRGILFNSGNELKQNVIQVLKEIFKLNIIDVDEQKEGDLSEDILIDNDGKKILGEIKGVTSQSPSPIYISQVWKHIHHGGYKDIADGCLILNYDIKTDPEERPLAYVGEYEQDLQDIIFIDTRVIFYLAIAVIDYGLSIEEAKTILFRKGRVTFDLESYLKGKSSPNE